MYQNYSTETGKQSSEKLGREVRGLSQSNIFGIKSQECGSQKAGEQEGWHGSDHMETVVPREGKERPLFVFLYLVNSKGYILFRDYLF